MKFDVLVTRDARCVRARVEGEAGVGRVLSLLRVLELDSHDWPQTAVLLDLKALEPNLDHEGLARIAGACARAFTRLQKIAIVSTPAGTGEEQGVRVFQDEAAAREWLDA